MIYSLIYRSHSLIDFDKAQLDELEETSNDNNLALNITGYLSLRGKTFYQYLEGNAEAIEQLYVKIAQDNRHEIDFTFRFPTRDERIFEDWGMKIFVYAAKINLNISHDFLVRDILNTIAQAPHLTAPFTSHLETNLKYINYYLKEDLK